ncbi:MAG: extracellular solute-binding protein [Elusimicrobia bacterium]|nr:extracellular solute-binding protein [Elusimicrobiota bacterium]
MKNRKSKIVFLAVFLATVNFVSCGKPKEKAENGEKKIVVWETYGNEEHSEILKIARQFENKNPGVEVDIQRVPWGGHESKIMTAMITNTAPDIARVDVAFLPRLVKSNSVLELSRFGEINTEDFVPAAIESNIFAKDGEKGIYGLPDQTTGVALFYNKTLFAKYGIKSPPKTWKEFVATAKKLTVDKNGDGKPDQFGFAMHKDLWWTFPFFNTFGVRFLSDDGKKCLLASDAGYEALQLKVDLYQKYKVEAGAWQSGSIDPDTGFLNGVYAMIFSGPWNVKRFRDAELDFGISLIPAGPAGTSTNVGGTNMVIMRRAHYPEICFEFLKYLTSPEIQAQWCQDLGQIPVNLKAEKLMDFSDNKEIKIFLEQMKTAIPRPKVVSYQTLALTVNPYLYAALAGEMSVKKALDTVAKKIETEVLVER